MTDSVSSTLKIIFIFIGLIIGVFIIFFIVDKFLNKGIKPTKKNCIFKRIFWNIDLIGKFVNKKDKVKVKDEESLEEKKKKREEFIIETFDEKRDQNLKQRKYDETSKPISYNRRYPFSHIRDTFKSVKKPKQQEFPNYEKPKYQENQTSTQSSEYSDSYLSSSYDGSSLSSESVIYVKPPTIVDMDS